MKFLCVCQAGLVRSHAMCAALKLTGRQDALACGWAGNDKETIVMLCEWADYIIVMQEKFGHHIPVEFREKIRVVDVGEDGYGNPFHQELFPKLSKIVEQWKKRGFKI